MKEYTRRVGLDIDDVVKWLKAKLPSSDPYPRDGAFPYVDAFHRGRREAFDEILGFLDHYVDPKLKPGDLVGEYSDTKFSKSEWVYVPQPHEVHPNFPFVRLVDGRRFRRVDLPRLIERIDRG